MKPSATSEIRDRPDWSLAGEETEEMTQDQFNDMFKVAMAAYRAELQDNDCGSYSAEGRQFMLDKGLMVGGNPLPNGEPNCMCPLLYLKLV